MVDRIVPATTDADRARVSEALGVEDAWPVMTEPFRQWVIEDDFPLGRPDWEKFGVTMVRDVRPFEEMKLRLLNGAHSSIAYLGLLSGHDTVAKSFGDPAIRRFVEALWAEAAHDASRRRRPRSEGLCRRTCRSVSTTRRLQHRTAQIANDGSQKLPQRIIGSALDRLAAGAGANHLMLTVAAWIRAAELRGTKLPARPFHRSARRAARPDRRSRAAGQGDGEPRSSSLPVSREATPTARALEKLASAHLDILRKDGVAAALAALQPTGKSAVKQTWRWFGPERSRPACRMCARPARPAW